MRRVLATETAKLVELETASGRLLVLGLRVVPVLALAALQCNDFAHNLLFHHVQLLLSWDQLSVFKVSC